MNHNIETLIEGNTIKIKNKETGLKAIIHKSGEGYAVRFRDMKTGEYFGEVRMFNLPIDAIRFAEKGVTK